MFYSLSDEVKFKFSSKHHCYFLDSFATLDELLLAHRNFTSTKWINMHACVCVRVCTIYLNKIFVSFQAPSYSFFFDSSRLCHSFHISLSRQKWNVFHLFKMLPSSTTIACLSPFPTLPRNSTQKKPPDNNSSQQQKHSFTFCIYIDLSIKLKKYKRQRDWCNVI